MQEVAALSVLPLKPDHQDFPLRARPPVYVIQPVGRPVVEITWVSGIVGDKKNWAPSRGN